MNYILNTFGKLPFQSQDIEKVMNNVRQDKKNEKGDLRFTLLQDIGKAEVNISVSVEQTEGVLKKYIEL